MGRQLGNLIAEPLDPAPSVGHAILASGYEHMFA
jgi:hypothetical protein